MISDLSSLAAGNSIDHTDEIAAVYEGDALTGGCESLANGAEHIDQAGQSGQIGQSEGGHKPNTPGEHDVDRLNQLEHSDQQASLVKDEDEVAHEQDKNLVNEEPVLLQLLPNEEDSRVAPSSEQKDVLQVTPSTNTMEAKTTTLDHCSQKGEDICPLPDEKSEKSELLNGLARCDDFSVGKDPSPKPHKSTTMPPTNQEGLTMKGE